MKKLRVAVVGCGRWGKNYVRVLDAIPYVDTVVLDSDHATLSAFKSTGHQASIVRDHDDIAAAVKHYDIDAAIVAVPATLHYNYASWLIDYGVNVLVEKPVTIYAKHYEMLARRARDQNVSLMAGHIFLYNEGVRTVRNIIDLGVIGEVLYVTMKHTNLGPFRHDVNVMYDLAPHGISIFNYVLGCNTPKQVRATGMVLGAARYHGIETTKPAYDAADISMMYTNNGLLEHTCYDRLIPANLHVSWCDPQKVRRLEVVGSLGKLSFDDVNGSKVTLHESADGARANIESYGEHLLYSSAGDVRVFHIEYREPLVVMVEHFLKAVLSGENCIGNEAYQVVKTLEDAYESAVSQNGGVVPTYM